MSSRTATSPRSRSPGGRREATVRPAQAVPREIKDEATGKDTEPRPFTRDAVPKGRHRERGNHSRRGISAELPERSGAVDPRQLDIHQDQVGVQLVREPDALFTGRRLGQAIPLELQNVPHGLAVLVVVLDDEDQFIRHAAPGA